MQQNRYPLYAEVVLDQSVHKTLDYGIPEAMVDKAAPGMRLEVPLRNRLVKGLLLSLKKESAFKSTRAIHQIFEDQPPLTPDLMELARWMAKYYCCTLEKVLQVMVPASVRKNIQTNPVIYLSRGIPLDEMRSVCITLRKSAPMQAAVLDEMLQISKRIALSELLERKGISRSAVSALEEKGILKREEVEPEGAFLGDADYFRTRSKLFSEEQQAAFEQVAADLDAKKFSPFLLYGVTGSGKTEVYLQLIERALKHGREALLLVPEVALTAQSIERLRSRFDERIAVIHHRITPGQRTLAWQRIARGEAPIVVGARSAVFAPLKNLGLIIVDEEHDTSYKQGDEMPCYHARDVAVMRAKLNNAVVMLGSATPALESRYNAEQGKYKLLTLKNRPKASALPTVKIIDMNREYEKQQGFTSFSSELLNGIKDRMEKGEQTLLFLNRRGYHTISICQACGEALSCAHCSVTLTFHKGENHLACHLCGYTVSPPPTKCPSCKLDQAMKFKGAGTELVERSLNAIFPEVRTLRMDGETTKKKGEHERLFHAFRAGKADVLIGTQMVVKGLHFPQVTLVGILNADLDLQIPDFRASERVFQLITQVAGRSGRDELPGEVVIQTRMANNKTICWAAQQNYDAFYEEELSSRRIFGYPPFSKLIKFRFSGTEADQVLEYAEALHRLLQKRLPKDFEFNPVGPSGYAKIKDHYYFHFLLRGHSVYALSQALEEILPQLKKGKVRLLVDVDTISTFH